jgi:hypothetical protein
MRDWPLEKLRPLPAKAIAADGSTNRCWLVRWLQR